MRFFPLCLLIISFVCLIQAASLASYEDSNKGLSLNKRITPACPLVKCLPQKTPGDARCTLYSSTKVDLNGCPSCDGCQKCPDQKLYDNSVKDYCSAQSSTSCSRKIGVKCLIACLTDTRCNALPFDREAVTCGCSCQECPDGNIYGSTNNYTEFKSLSTINAAQCPNVLHPVQPPLDLCL